MSMFLNNNQLLTRIINIFGYIMILLFFMIGFYILFSPSYKYIDFSYRLVFAIFMFAYGFFRLVRQYYKNKQQKEEEE